MRIDVLFIDDEAAIRQAVRQWLELSGVSVRVLRRGRRGAAAARPRLSRRAGQRCAHARL